MEQRNSMVGIGPCQRLAEVIPTDTILAAAVAMQARMQPDPRLAAMRSIWIEAENDLSDAPGVATCFANEVSQTLPLTLVADKNRSQVVLRFRPIENRIELSVLMHDNQQLWSGTAAVPRGRTVTLTSRQCVAARVLIEHLRSGMRCARDGTSYQQPPDHSAEH